MKNHRNITLWLKVIQIQIIESDKKDVHGFLKDILQDEFMGTLYLRMI